MPKLELVVTFVDSRLNFVRAVGKCVFEEQFVAHRLLVRFKRILGGFGLED